MRVGTLPLPPPWEGGELERETRSGRLGGSGVGVWGACRLLKPSATFVRPREGVGFAIQGLRTLANIVRPTGEEG